MQVFSIRVFGKRMQVGDKKVAPVFAGILQFNEILERAEIVADMQSARGLDAGDQYGFLYHVSSIMYQQSTFNPLSSKS